MSNPDGVARRLRIPVDDLLAVAWKKSLAACTRIKVFDVAEVDRAEDEESASVAKAGGIMVDWNLKG
jgi:hypothetical protein